MDNPLTDAEIAELLELEAKATPAPWECGRVVDPGITFDADVDIFPPDTTETHGFQFGGPVCVVSGRSEGENHEFIAGARNSLRRALRELVERREAERKEWQLVPLNKGAFLPSGLVDSEADADSRMARWPNTYRKQYRIAAGPWMDAESEKEKA